MGVAENIDALMVKYDVSQSALADIAGVDKSTVSYWRNQGRRPRDEAVKRMCDWFDLTPDDILSDRYGLAAREHGHFGLSVYSGGEAMVPLITLGRVHAGDLTDEETVERRVEVPSRVLAHHPNAWALIVEGDCMDRVAPEGMTVLIDPDLTPVNGSIVVAEIDLQAVMRRWYRGSGTLMLVADSYTEHEDIVMKWEEGPVRVLGVVVWVQSSEELV